MCLLKKTVFLIPKKKLIPRSLHDGEIHINDLYLIQNISLSYHEREIRYLRSFNFVS